MGIRNNNARKETFGVPSSSIGKPDIFNEKRPSEVQFDQSANFGQPGKQNTLTKANQHLIGSVPNIIGGG